MQPRWISLLAVSLCLMMPLVPAKSATVRLPYEGPAPLAFQGLEECAPSTLRGVGVICLDLPPQAQEVVFRVDDTSMLHVGGTYYLYDADDQFAGQGVFCRSHALALDRAVATIVVRLEAGNGPMACLAEGDERAGLPTRGVVSFDLW